MDYDLDTRAGWPDELRVLLADHPRATWRTRGSAMAEFWLAQHDSFRRQCLALQSAANDFRGGRCSAAQFATWLEPQLRAFLGHLAGHHQVEDYHYFPAFRAVDRRLASGFEVLGRDHETIAGALDEIVSRANELLGATRSGKGADDAARAAAERYIGVGERLFRRLVRHLDDEEDLVIPIMLAGDR